MTHLSRERIAKLLHKWSSMVHPTPDVADRHNPALYYYGSMADYLIAAGLSVGPEKEGEPDEVSEEIAAIRQRSQPLHTGGQIRACPRDVLEKAFHDAEWDRAFLLDIIRGERLDKGCNADQARSVHLAGSPPLASSGEESVSVDGERVKP